MAKAKSSDLMKVRFLISLSGIGFSFTVGEVVEIDPTFAEELINAGYAEESK